MAARDIAVIYPIEFNDESFADRAALAGHLCSLTKRSANATALMLSRLGDDPVAVLAHYRKRDSREFARIGTRSYRTRRDFSRYVARYFRIPKSTVEDWLKRGQSVDAVLARAKERHARKPPSDFPNPRQPVTIFGWRFRSYNAMCRYYRRGSPPPDGWREQWVEHIDEGGVPVRFLPMQEAIIRQWQWGELDERNRFSPEIEQRELYRWLPLNAEPEEVTDKFERSLVDALQPTDQMTLRRSCLKRLEEQRSRTGPNLKDQS
jgi:hypothetical protein